MSITFTILHQCIEQFGSTSPPTAELCCTTSCDGVTVWSSTTSLNVYILAFLQFTLTARPHPPAPTLLPGSLYTESVNDFIGIEKTNYPQSPVFGVFGVFGGVYSVYTCVRLTQQSVEQLRRKVRKRDTPSVKLKVDDTLLSRTQTLHIYRRHYNPKQVRKWIPASTFGPTALPPLDSWNGLIAGPVALGSPDKNVSR